MNESKLTVRLEEFRIDLKKPFRISRDVYDHKLGIRVIISGEGLTGYGEASEHGYYQVDLTSLKTQLSALKKVVESQKLIHPREMYQVCLDTIGFRPFALAALDMAYWDWYGKMNGRPSRALFDLDLPKRSPIFSSYTISIDTPEKMVDSLHRHAFKYYKIKLGTEDDIGLMKSLLSKTKSALYIDANCGWALEQTIAFERALRDTNLCMIEQPLPSDRWDDMKKLKSQSEIPLIADESFVHISDMARCNDAFDGVNIKILKCGGITPGIEILKQAHRNKMKVMIGCMMESSIGIAAAVQLAPYVDFLDIDSPLLLKYDPGIAISISDNGEVILPTKAGNGSGLKPNS